MVDKKNPDYKPGFIGNPVDYSQPGVKSPALGNPVDYSQPGIKPPHSQIGTIPEAPPVDTDEDSAPDIQRPQAPPPRQDQVVSFSGIGRRIPVYFGLCRGSGDLIAAFQTGSYLYTLHRFGWGEISGFMEVYANGELLWAGGPSTHEQQYDNVQGTIQIVFYHGLPTQPPDPVFAAQIPGYADDLVKTVAGQTRGCSYLRTRVLAGSGDPFPDIEAVMQGLLCEDPRSPGPKIYSTNPAVICNEYEKDAFFGRNRTVDPASVIAMADQCDAIVPGGGKRHTMHLAIEQKQTTLQWSRTMSRFYGSFIVRLADDDQYDVEFATLRETPTSFTWNSDDDIMATEDGATTLNHEGLGPADRPNRIVGWWSKRDDWPWRESAAIAPADDTPIVNGTEILNDETMQLPAIDNYEEGYRKVLEQYNKHRLENTRMRFELGAEGLLAQAGDVAEITHTPSFVDYKVRLAHDPIMVEPGFWSFTGTNYDAARFSDIVATEPSYELGGTLDPRDPPNLTGTVTAREEIGPEEGTVGLVSKLRIEFPAEDWPYVDRYSIVVFGGGVRQELVAFQATPGNLIVVKTPNLSGLKIRRNGSLFRVEVRIVSTIGDNESASPATASTTVYGKWWPPPATNFQRMEVDPETGDISIEVQQIDDVGGPCRYEYRYSTDPAATWDTAVKLFGGRPRAEAFVTIRTYLTEDDSVYYLFCKTVDNVGLRSDDAARAQIIVDPGIRQQVGMEFWPDPANDFVSGFKVFDVTGFGVFAASTRDPEHTLVSRFGEGAAWTDTDKPLYETKDWSDGSGSWQPGLGTNIFSTQAMRKSNYQVEIKQTKTDLVQYRQIIRVGGNLTSNNGAQWHTRMSEYYPSVDYNALTNPSFTNDDAIFIKFPFNTASRISPLYQEGTISTNINQSPHVIIFPEEYENVPAVISLLSTLSGSGRSISLSIDSVSAASLTVISDASSGGGNQTFDLYWSVQGT